MKHAGAVAGAAHAGVGDANHVANAFLEQFVRNGKHAPFGNARGADGTCVLENDDVVTGQAERLIVEPCLHVRVVRKDDGRTAVFEEIGLSRSRFDDTPIGREIATKDKRAAGLGDGLIDGADDVVIKDFSVADALTEGFFLDIRVLSQLGDGGARVRLRCATSPSSF